MASREFMDAARPGDILRVIHDFTRRSPDELSLAKNDLIELHERDDEFGDGWFLGKHLGNGELGLFPEVYTALEPKSNRAGATRSAPLRSFHDQNHPEASIERIMPTSNFPELTPYPAPLLEPATVPLSPQHDEEMAEEEDERERNRTKPLQTPGNSAPSHSNKSAPTALPHRSMALVYGGENRESPMINDTLSKIDEHLKTHTPRQSVVHTNGKFPTAAAAAAAQLAATDSGSEYSSHIGNRRSYINGHETDEEENQGYTEQEVMSWSPRRVAEFLEDVGIERPLCDEFCRQEMNGEVILNMEQGHLFIEDLKLGPIGPRLRIWQKVKALQEEVRHTMAQRTSKAPRSISDYSHTTGEDSTSNDAMRLRSSSLSTMLPRIPSVMDSSQSSVTSRHRSNQRTTGSSSHHSQLPYSALNRVEPQSPSAPLSNSSFVTSPKVDAHSIHSIQSAQDRPSAASIRDLQQQHRRHSSLDPANTSPRYQQQPVQHPPSSANTSDGGPRSPTNFRTHIKNQSSLDRSWLMTGESSPVVNGSPSQTRRPSSQQQYLSSPAMSSDAGNFERAVLSDLHMINDDRHADIDRGYFSGGEVENRRSRRFLRKRDSPGHSRQSSFFKSEDLPQQPNPPKEKGSRRRSSSVAAITRHARAASHDSMREAGRILMSPAAQVYYGKTKRKGFRSQTQPEPTSRQHTTIDRAPAVTKLEYDKSASIDTVTSNSPKVVEGDGGRSSRLGRSSESSTSHSLFSRTRTTGLRTVSDIVNPGKGMVSSPIDMTSSTQSAVLKDGALHSPVGTASSVTSNTTKSLELDASDMTKSSTSGSMRSTTVPLMQHSQLHHRPTLNVSGNTSTSSSTTLGTRRRAKSRSKKQISALAHGLEKKTPAEQMVGSDYSGWMKKKSSNLMTTWKPRLFVLRGRRLSYYYAETDTEEKGLIDISGHRVLPANNERITGLHAQLTGAATSPTTPPSASASTAGSANVSATTSPTATTHQHPNPLHSPVNGTAPSPLNPNGNASSLPTTPSSPTSPSVFIFKLVPPRSGTSKGVNFTRPAVHYFAVDNVTTARLWMAALVKATIDHDVPDAPLTTTYTQKTISLERARQLRHRPPALMDQAPAARADAAKGKTGEKKDGADEEPQAEAGREMKTSAGDGRGLAIDMDMVPEDADAESEATTGNEERKVKRASATVRNSAASGGNKDSLEKGTAAVGSAG